MCNIKISILGVATSFDVEHICDYCHKNRGLLIDPKKKRIQSNTTCIADLNGNAVSLIDGVLLIPTIFIMSFVQF